MWRMVTLIAKWVAIFGYIYGIIYLFHISMDDTGSQEVSGK